MYKNDNYIHVKHPSILKAFSLIPILKVKTKSTDILIRIQRIDFKYYILPIDRKSVV